MVRSHAEAEERSLLMFPTVRVSWGSMVADTAVDVLQLGFGRPHVYPCAVSETDISALEAGITYARGLGGDCN